MSDQQLAAILEEIKEIHEVIELAGGAVPNAGEPQVSEAYLEKQIVGGKCGAWLFDIVQSFAHLHGVHWDYVSQRVEIDPWDNHKEISYPFEYRYFPSSSAGEPSSVGRGAHNLRFTNIGFDPLQSKIVYGDPKTIAAPGAELKGQAFLIDASNFDHDVEHRIERTETLTRSVTHTTGEEFTSSTGVEFGGSIPGTGFEAKVQQTVGIKLDDSTTDFMSTDASQTIGDSVIAPAWKKTLIYFEKVTQTIASLYWLDLVWAFGIDIALAHSSDHWGDAGASNPGGGTSWKDPVRYDAPWLFSKFNKDGGALSYSFGDLLELHQFLYGIDIDNPAMKKFPPTIRNTHVMRSLDNLLDAEQRRFQLTGTRQQTWDDAVTYRVADVTNLSDGEIERQHGSVTPIPPDSGILDRALGAPLLAPYWLRMAVNRSWSASATASWSRKPRSDP